MGGTNFSPNHAGGPREFVWLSIPNDPVDVRGLTAGEW